MQEIENRVNYLPRNPTSIALEQEDLIKLRQDRKNDRQAIQLLREQTARLNLVKIQNCIQCIYFFKQERMKSRQSEDEKRKMALESSSVKSSGNPHINSSNSEEPVITPKVNEPIPIDPETLCLYNIHKRRYSDVVRKIVLKKHMFNLTKQLQFEIEREDRSKKQSLERRRLMEHAINLYDQVI